MTGIAERGKPFIAFRNGSPDETVLPGAADIGPKMSYKKVIPQITMTTKFTESDG